MDDLDERTQLAAVGVAEAIDGFAKPSARDSRARPRLDSCSDAVLRAAYFDADVVPAAVVSAVQDQAEGAVLENQQCGRRIDVAMLAKVRRTLIRACGVDLHDLLTTDPSDHVEVMDRAVSEDPA